MKRLNKFIAILFATFGVQVASAQTEIISNGNNLNKQCNFGSVSNHTIPEVWTSDGRQGFNFSQSVELPNGVYKLSFQMMYRASLKPGISTNCALYAETSGEVYNTPIKNFGDESGVAENLSGVTSAMNAGKYLNTIPYFVVTDGKATVGARSLGPLTYCTNGYWTIFNPASFKLVSVVDGATLTNALNDVKKEAKTILDAAAASDAKTTLQAAYNAATATSDGIIALKKAIKAYLPNTGTAANPVDVSSLILSADFSQKAFIVATKNNKDGVSEPELQPVGWTCTDGGNGQYNFFNVVNNNATYDGQSNFAYNGKTTGQTLYMRQAWADNVTISAKQTVTLPNGRYKVSIPAKKSGNTATIKYTFAGETETHNLTTNWAVYEKIFTVNDANNTLTIELSYYHPSGGGQRAFFDGVTLLCYGDPIAALLTEIESKKAELEAYSAKIPTAMYTSFAEHLTAAENANNTQTEAELQEIINNLNADINKAYTSVNPYASLKSLISLCTEYTYTKNSNANSATILTNFQAAINSATTGGKEALSVNEINAAYNNLESARQTYTQNAVPVYPYAFDMTFLLGNTTFDSNIDGWTKTGNAGWMSAGNVECYNSTFTFSKSLTGLGNGSWEVSVYGFYRYGGYNDAEAAHNNGTEELLVKFFANASEVGLMSIMEGANKAGNVGATTSGGMRVPNSPAEGNIYFETGCYNNTVVTLVTDGKLTLGLKKESTKGYDWTLFDNFKLVYKGIDVSELQTNLTALISKANGIKSSKMGATEKTNLTKALNAADATVTVADRLNEMLSELQSAYDAAVASIDTYITVPAYITKANKIDASIAANYQTQFDNGTLVGDAETIRQELSVATFNYVKENFKNEIQLTTWGAESNAMWSTSGEHWDGTSGEGCTSYYDANGTNTTHTLSKTVELTPGTYVFRAAGRSNANTELSLSISIDGVDPVIFNAKGNTGRGIDKTGNATFADDAEYARDGQGQGWEWEFIKFTLNEKTTVTLTATSKTTGWGWASFANNGLWMDDATYVIANAGALTEPKAAAKALVDTKPMGAAENAALKEAISRAEGTLNTPADLNGAIKALNDAVANANAWIPKYNEAKVPLVTALERFETDFNLEGTPNHKYMRTGAWNNVLDMVKEAALAKDVTDSYKGFEAAANNLNAALDAAQKSINTYANFAAEISYAKAYTPIVSDNIAGHRASINAAETAYNAAEIEDPSKLILAMQNYRVQDYNYVKENYIAFELTGDWTGQTNLHSGEDWSGNPEIKYFDYSKHSSNNIDGANEATLTTTLPAGEYILMAAGRAAAIDGTEAYIKVNETKVNFAAKSNRGYGIDVYGDANFATPTDSTYAMNNEGYGWEYRFIAFTLEKETEVKLVAGMTIDHSTAELSWASVCTPVLYITPIAEAKARLQKAIDDAENAIKAYAVGEEAFRVSESSKKYVALENAIATAKNVINTENTVNALKEAIAPLESVTENYRNDYVLNAPKEGQRFYIKVATEGHPKLGNAVLATLGATSDNNPTGYGLNCNYAVNGNLTQKFTFTQVEGNIYNISIEKAEGTVYLTYGSLNGSAAGWKNQQIQATTDDAKKGEFKIEATTKEGVLKILNTIDNNYLDCQEGGSIYTDTNIQNEEFNFELASEEHTITLTISSAKWSTLILPFNAEVPEGVKAYTCAGVIDGVLTFNEPTTTIVANTPYLVGGNAGKYNFSGYGLADKDSYTEGLFTGTYVDYQTEANKGIYVLQKHDNEVAFYEVRDSAQPWVRANRCYITYEEVSGARMLRLGFGDDDTTGIDNMQFPTDNSGVTIYDTMGRKVTSMKKGNLYIMNGRKVVVK